MFPISRYMGFCDSALNVYSLVHKFDFTGRKSDLKGYKWDREGRIPRGHRSSSQFSSVMVINCYHSTRGQQPLKRIVLHIIPREQGEHKAYGTPTKPAWTPPQHSPAHWGQDEPMQGTLCTLCWSLLVVRNIPYSHYGNLLLFLHSAFLELHRRYQHSFILPSPFIQHLRIYYMQGIGFMLWESF